MTQRDLDQHSQPPETLSAASLPSRDQLSAGTRLVRPDRQFTYGDVPPDEWPPPIRHDWSLTVDRLHAGVDGPPHRFLICIGDDVEVVLDSTSAKGRVADIDHSTQAAYVGIRPFGLKWVSKEDIHPAPSTAVSEEGCVNPLDPARQIRQLAKFEEIEYDPLGLVPVRPVLRAFKFHEFPRLLTGRENGELSYLDYRSEFERLVASREAIIGELKECLKARPLARLAAAFGATNTRRATKDANAVSVFRAMLRSFVLDDAFSPSSTESFEEAVARTVRATTSNQHFEHYWRKSNETDDRN